MAMVDSQGARLNATAEGPEHAPVVMFSNSLGTNLGMWDRQVAAIAGRFRIIRYDNRGHGGSTAPEGEYTLDQLGRDAIAVMDHFGVKRVHWCGVSLGGMVGQWLGAHAPERINTLLLANTASYYPEKAIWAERLELVRAKGMAPLAEATLERWYTPAFRARDTGAVERTRAMLLSTSPAGYAGCCAAIRDLDLRESNRRISRPTLIIAGRNDPATPLSMAEVIERDIPRSKLDILDAAHLSNIECPHEFNQRLESQLSLS